MQHKAPSSYPLPVLLTVAEVAEILQKNKETIRRMHRQGILPAHRGYKNPLRWEMSRVQEFLEN